jgi:tRNA threonylcarbamoyl adenosine modification protein YeaZ
VAERAFQATATTGYDHTAVLILALDTTTRAGSVAVTDDDTLLAVVHGDGDRTHGERLPAEIERALAAAGVRPAQLELVTVASGPGAFTGLRIGLAAIQGLAMVLEIPVIGVSALDALAWEAWAVRRDEERYVIAWMDAQRGEVFAAHYDARDFLSIERSGEGEPNGRGPQRASSARWGASGEPLTAEGGPTRVARPIGEAGPSSHMEGVGFSPAVSEPIVGTPDAVLKLMDIGVADTVLSIGDGAVRYRAELEARFPGHCRVIDMPAALAPAVARIGRRRAERGEAGPPHALQPLYVRRPDAELERQRRSGLVRRSLGEGG